MGQAPEEELDGVSTREYEPVVTVEMIERFVEAIVVVRFADLDGGGNDDIGAMTLEQRGQVRSLRRRTRDDNSPSFEWCPIQPANPVILLKMLDRITRLTELTRCREAYNNARAPREIN